MSSSTAPESRDDEKKVVEKAGETQDSVSMEQQPPQQQSDEPVDVSKDEIVGSVATPTTSEALPESSNASFGGWFSSIVQSAKETVNKSADTIESIKRDLSEFKDAIQIDSMVSSTASVMKKTFTEIGNTVNEIGSLGSTSDDNGKSDLEIVEVEGDKEAVDDDGAADNTERKGSFKLDRLNSLTNMITDKARTTFGLVKDTLVDTIFINRDYFGDEMADELFVNKNGEIIPIENWQQLLHKLQTDSDTYCREPASAPEDYEAWLAKFSLHENEKQMEYLLENVPEIRKYHDELVPEKLTESDFWHRYYFKLYQLKEEQKRLILDVSTPTTTNSSSSVSPARKPNQSVNVTYLNEKSPASSVADDWEKMGGNSVASSDVEKRSKDNSSDDERDWVKCD